MAKTCEANPFPKASGEGDDFLKLWDGGGLEVELRAGKECLRPRVMEIACLRIERDIWIKTREFLLELWIEGGDRR